MAGRRAIRVLVSMIILGTLVVGVQPGHAAQTHTAPFDNGIMCGTRGRDLPRLNNNYVYFCFSDDSYSTYEERQITRLPKNGHLLAGGAGYGGAGPAVGYLYTITEASSIINVHGPLNETKTVSATLDLANIRADQFQSNLAFCLRALNVFTYGSLASDCFNKGQPARELSVTFVIPYDTTYYPIQMRVSVLSPTLSPGLGYARVLEVTVS